jgi:predicted nucleic acid-binding protein
MTVLADTSVWIRFLAGREPILADLRRRLLAQEVLGHELVYGELLIGDVGGRAAVLAGYAEMEFAALVPHEEIVAFVRRHKLHGRGIGWIDAHLLASALVAGSVLWTADARVAKVAAELGAAYAPA